MQVLAFNDIQVVCVKFGTNAGRHMLVKMGERQERSAQLLRGMNPKAARHGLDTQLLSIVRTGFILSISSAGLAATRKLFL